MDRRSLFRESVALAAGIAAAGIARRVDAAKRPVDPNKAPLFKISLAEWSLHRLLFEKKIHHLDFARIANGFGIDSVEYVNQFFKDKAKDRRYLAEMKKRAADEGVWSAIIMVDGEGKLGDWDPVRRKEAVENHKKWVEAAAYLGCHSLRVNAYAEGSTPEEASDRTADGLRRLTEFAEPLGINIVVENHGGWSSNGAWVVKVMKAVDHPRCGTLPDFGNWELQEGTSYDRYKGMEETMPFAKAVSAKSYAFDRRGNETTIDYFRIMKIVVAAGYRGYVGIEYEGDDIHPYDGIVATKRLLERVRARLGGAA